MNLVIMVGTLTGDPESRTKNDLTITNFRMAVKKRYKRGDVDADFVNCVCFGKTAEFVAKYFAKGRRIAIQGELENNDYTNKEGVKVHSYQITVSSAEFVDSKPVDKKSDEDGGFMQIPEGLEDEIPFA